MNEQNRGELIRQLECHHEQLLDELEQLDAQIEQALATCSPPSRVTEQS